MTLRQRRRLYAITVADVERIAGRTLTPGELARVQDAIPHSSIPEALTAILDGMGFTPEDKDEDEEQDECPDCARSYGPHSPCQCRKVTP